MKDISLYIHIPFCKSKCNYCDFLSYDNKAYVIKEYIYALIEEIKSYSKKTEEYIVRSIFIGGGTPSILSCTDIESILKAVTSNYNIHEDAEITIEANPGTLNEEKIGILQSFGVNRISLGLQSCNNKILKKLGRIHTWEEFLVNYNLLKKYKFDNINIDMMFALPDQTMIDLEKDINSIIALQPKHISYYSLIIEEGTIFSKLNKKNKLKLPDEEVERNMYWLIDELLHQNGYKHYEISNYAMEGKECYHNKVYWTEKEYIGMGLGASSFFQGFRYKNITNINEYIKYNGIIDRLIENIQKINKETSIEEYMFLGLRLLDGIDELDFYKRWGHEINYYYGDVIKGLISDNLITHNKNMISLTRKGIDISNYVLSQFLFE